MHARVLIIAGSDSSGGAGIQADIKTVTTLGGYAATAITVLTAQNTQGILSVLPVDPDFIAKQIRSVLTDIGADCIKIGMLYSATTIQVVADMLEDLAAATPLILDPVMNAKDGTSLLEPEAIQLLKQRLLPKAYLITPNLPEAQILTGLEINDLKDMEQAAVILLKQGATSVLVKGGHLIGNHLWNLLVTKDYTESFRSQRIISAHTHGTGCTLASAIATGIAQGRTLINSVRRAQVYVQEAIRTAKGYGAGQGPLNHTHTVNTFEI